MAATLTIGLVLDARRSNCPTDRLFVQHVAVERGPRLEQHGLVFLLTWCSSWRVGNDEPAIAGTLWAAYNGIAEMVDHGRSRRTAKQHLEHIWFGSGYSLKVRASNWPRRASYRHCRRRPGRARRRRERNDAPARQ